jgi:tRNA(fMet)-specific endonuclease VapC
LTLYLPDTNVVSLMMRRDAGTNLMARQALDAGGDLILSPLVEYEVRRGLIRKRATVLTERFEELVREFVYLPLGRLAWIRAAELWAYSRDVGAPIPDADTLIAAHAVELDAVLVTDNTRHFEVFEPRGLRLENWVTA